MLKKRDFQEKEFAFNQGAKSNLSEDEINDLYDNSSQINHNHNDR